MARIDVLPSIEIIRGFKRILDFYLWRGLPCVRAWPQYRPARQTDASKASALLFGAIIKAFALTHGTVLEQLQIEATGIPRTPRDIYVSGVYGKLHLRTIPEPPPPPEEQMYNAYICLRDKKPQNTMGGDFTAGAWRTRDLTEEQADPQNICTLGANQFVLEPGTYRCLISCPAMQVERHQARLYNITANATLLDGSCENMDRTQFVCSRSLIAGRFTVAAAQTLQVQHRCSYTRTVYGFGPSCTWTDEIYTILEAWRETPPT